MYALIDCNSFYCSCERLFRPELKHRPVVVLSNNDGCIISRTDEAKRLGIPMGAPFFKVKDLCRKKGVAVFSANFSLYTDLSNRVMGTLYEQCPKVEVYSIDEAFADLSGVAHKESLGRELRSIILKNIGVPVGIGIASTKVLAKVANHLAKKSQKAGGVVYLSDQRLVDIALKRTPVEDIWGIGRKSAQKLINLGLKTAFDFKEYDNEKLIKRIFTKVGLQIQEELRGINCFSFAKELEKKESIMCSRSFGKSVYDKSALKESVANYITNAAGKMRAQESLCTRVSVFARTNRFKATEQYYLYGEREIAATSDTRKIMKVALDLIDEHYREGYEYKKAGARLSGFCLSSELQIDFLREEDSLADNKLMQAIDLINKKKGEGSIKLGACGLDDSAWKMNRNYKSPRYLSSWNELKEFK